MNTSMLGVVLGIIGLMYGFETDDNVLIAFASFSLGGSLTMLMVHIIERSRL